MNLWTAMGNTARVGLLVWVLPAIAAAEDRPAYLDPSLGFEARAWDLVSRMTLDEKIGQVMHSAAAIERLGIPAYNWWNECLHGVARAGEATVFPQAIGLAATFDKAWMHRTAVIISDEARAKHHDFVKKGQRGIYQGLTFWSPNINIFRDPRWGRGQETYGEDPYLTGQMGIQFVKGLQGDDPKYLKLVATAKHFAVHSGPEPLRHGFNAIVNKRDLYETYLPAFRDLIVTGKAYSVMGAYNRVDGESASASQMLLVDVLRGQWEFDGYVVSDCRAIRDIFGDHKIAAGPDEASAIGVRRGCDLECGDAYRSLGSAVKRGLITEQEIDLSVHRLMLARMKLGMFDPDEKVSYARIPFSKNDCPEHNEAALQMARKSVVLLKNAGVLPLRKDTLKTIAVVGPNADSVTALLGNYNGTPSRPVTILQGIRDAVGQGVQVRYTKGCDLVEGYQEEAEFVLVEPKCLESGDAGRVERGLKGEYFNDVSLSGKPTWTRIDAEINFKWAAESPTADGIRRGEVTADQEISKDQFSVRWTGRLIAPETGSYSLGFSSEDGCRLSLDGKKLIDDWRKRKFKMRTCQARLEAGKAYSLTIEYFHTTGESQVWFGWRPPQEASRKTGFDLAVEYTRQADVALFVGGLCSTLEGEQMQVNHPGFKGGDRTDISLPQSQHKLLQAMHATGRPVVLVMLTGSALALNWEQENLAAVLCAWYPGQRGGNAVADVLFGNYNPAGRLPVTFYRSVEQLPPFEDYCMQGRTYRYFDGEVLYPFGHGLSYTTFEYADLHLSKNQVLPADSVEVSFRITNTGKKEGEEVAQMYVRRPKSRLPMPVKQLRGFERISLRAGESKKVTMTLSPKQDMAYYDVLKDGFAVEPGEFEIHVGASSRDIRLKGVLTVQ